MSTPLEGCGLTPAERKELKALDHKVKTSGLDSLTHEEMNRRLALVDKTRQQVIVNLLWGQNRGFVEIVEPNTQHNPLSATVLSTGEEDYECTPNPGSSHTPQMEDQLVELIAPPEETSVNIRLENLHEALHDVEGRIDHYQSVLVTWKMEALAIKRQIQEVKAERQSLEVEGAERGSLGISNTSRDAMS